VADRREDARGNPRIYDLIKHVPKETEGKSPSIWAWPQVVDLFKVAGQPVPGPWPPHQEARPDPESESIPIAIPEQRTRRVSLPESRESTGRSVSLPRRPTGGADG
jgi:hypothetical protein